MTKHLIIIFSLLCLPAFATDYYVGTQSALTGALGQATSGDTVWLSNGTYQASAELSDVLVVPAGVILVGSVVLVCAASFFSGPIHHDAHERELPL